MALYVQLDTNWPDHPKVIAAGLDGAGLHAAALCLAKRLLTDGVLYRTQLLRIGATDELIDRLLEVGLFEPVDDARVAVHDWLDRNPSRGAIGGRVGAMRDDGKRGNHKRWSHPVDYADCPICHPEKAQVVAKGDRGRVGGRVARRSPPIARDIDRDRLRDAGARELERHPERPPPDIDRNLTGIAAARAAARHREDPS